MLEVRLTLEHCNKSLSFDYQKAMICKFEYIFYKIAKKSF
ncbi:DUF1272 domain-containing protein [uncultured Aquimarina sp.]